MMNGRDPFSDPFFTQDPFARMNTMMSGMMGGMFNDPFFQSGPFGPQMMMGGGMQPRLDHRPAQSRRRASQSQQPDEGVVIEEVDDQHQPRHGRRAHHEPTVEEPDDDRHQPHHRPRHTADAHRQQSQQQQQQQQRSGRSMPDMFGGMPGFAMSSSNMGNGGGTVFSYSSSSYSSGGPGGVAYSSSTTHRQGPGGVAETHQQTYDGRSGQETIKVSRTLGDKARTITRTRDANGRERAVDDLRNIDQGEASRFDQEWATHAQRTLPQSRRSQVSSGGSRRNGQYLLDHTAPRYA